MKLFEIANNIDKSKNNESYIDITKFNYELDFKFDDWIKQDRLKSYWIGNWCCTDTWVGYRMYFLDDEPVAVSTQKARKCDEEFEWFSEELALRVRNYLISLIQSREDLKVKTCDINDDIGDGYKIQYNSHIINKNMATLNQEPIQIVERIKETPDFGIDSKLKIKLSTGEEKIVKITELDFKFNLA